MRKVFQTLHYKPSKSLYRALFMGFLMIIVLGYIIFNEQDKYQRAIFDKEVSKIQANIQSRLTNFKLLSESLADFVSFQDHVREVEWHAYTEKLLRSEKDTQANFNVSFVKFVNATEIEQFKNVLLQEWLVDPLLLQKTLHLTPNKDHYCIVKYSTLQKLKGVDLCRSPKFDALLMNQQNETINTLSLDTQSSFEIQGKAIHFISKTSYFQQPLSTQQKRGWTIISLSLQRFFDGIVSNDFILEAYDLNDHKQLIYLSAQNDVESSRLIDISVDIGANKILVRIIPNQSHDLFKTPKIIFIGFALCILLTILIGHLVWSLTLSRRRSQSLAENIQQDLYMTKLRNRSIIDNIPGTVYRMVEKDDEWVIEYMSDYVREMIGFPSAKYTGKNRFTALQFDPLEIDELKNALNFPSEAGSYTLEYKVRHADGSMRWFSEQGHVVSHKNSQKFVAAIIFDVTELKEKNKRMQTLYSALHNAVEGISILTNNLCLIEVNQAFSSLFSISEDQIIGNALCDFLHPDDQEALQNECKQHKNERFSFMVRVMIDTNHFQYAQLLFVPIFGIDGNKTGYYCFAKDLSPLLERERALSEALLKTKSAYQAKSEFLANVSHELRTPLNAIIGYSELILEEEDLTTKVVLQDVEKIKQAGTHLLKLISDILDASKLEAGKIELHYETFDVFDFSNTLVSLLMPSAQKLENSVILNCNHQIGLMTSDYTRLRQCLLNLMSNACKFTQKGIVTLTITEAVINSISYIQFKVSDTGCGIGPKALKKLFQPFTQGDSSTTRRYGGTGLGLSITKQFTELLGGCIDVQSEYGRGSTFTILIPQQQPTVTAKCSEQNQSTPSNFKNVI